MTICLTSAKKRTGVHKILSVLEKTKNQLQHLKYLTKVYVMGTTNSGKSSLINSMVLLQNKYKTHLPVLTESALPGTT